MNLQSLVITYLTHNSRRRGRPRETEGWNYFAREEVSRRKAIVNLMLFFCKKHILSKTLKKLGKLNGAGKIYYSHGTNHSKGMMTLFITYLDFEIESIKAGNICCSKLICVKLSYLVIFMLRMTAPPKKLLFLTSITLYNNMQIYK